MWEGRRLLHDVPTVASHTNNSKNHPAPPLMSAHDDAVVLTLPGGQHLPSASTPTARCAALFLTVPSWRTLQTSASRKMTG